MSKGKKAAIGAALLVLVALVSGLTTMAVTSYGTRDDPLVTLSYLNETLTPQLEERFNEALEQKVQEMTEELEALAGESGGGGNISSQPSGFVVVTLNNGQTLTCGVGTEIMLRLGTAVSAGADSPRLIDETGGVSVTAADTALEVNHMYMVTIKGNGVKATRDSTKLLIRGEYTIG